MLTSRRGRREAREGGGPTPGPGLWRPRGHSTETWMGWAKVTPSAPFTASLEGGSQLSSGTTALILRFHLLKKLGALGLEPNETVAIPVYPQLKQQH